MLKIKIFAFIHVYEAHSQTHLYGPFRQTPVIGELFRLLYSMNMVDLITMHRCLFKKKKKKKKKKKHCQLLSACICTKYKMYSSTFLILKFWSVIIESRWVVYASLMMICSGRKSKRGLFRIIITKTAMIHHIKPQRHDRLTTDTTLCILLSSFLIFPITFM
jgi:hypothetical protein